MILFARVETLMLARSLIPILLAALAMAGCVGPIGPIMPAGESFGPDFGSIALERIVVEAVESAPQEVAAVVHVRVRTVNAEAPQIKVYLDDEGCSDYGPPSVPSTPVASHGEHLSSDATHDIETTLRGSGSVGLKGSVFVWAEAENSIGPIFGVCKEFSRVPRAAVG